jgi:hypothetical protein
MVCFPLATYKVGLYGKGYRTNCGAILRNILDAHSRVNFASFHCLSKISIPNPIPAPQKMFLHYFKWPHEII